jgi:rod shape-determining protein MreD
MRPVTLPITLSLVVLAVLLQTTLFGEGKIQPLGASPALVTIVVIAVARHLEPEPALLVAFTGGLLMDLLGASPLGLWAISITTVGYLTVRLRRQEDRGLLLVGIGVFGLVFLGNVLFSIVGTLFGQRTLTDSDVVDLMVLPALYSLILAAGLFPLTTRLLNRGRDAVWQP